MKIEKEFEHLTEELMEVGEMMRGRRGFIKAGMITGAASAFAMMAATGVALGQDKMKKDKKDKKMKDGGGMMHHGSVEEDIKMLNTALGLEYTGIYAYNVAAGTKLLSEGILPVAVLFRDQHEEHASLEVATIKKLGGTPVARADKYDLGDLSAIKTEKDLLGFALGLEVGAASAYLSLINKFHTAELIPVVGGIGANEAQHAALLRFAMGEKNPVPQAVVK